MPDYDSMTPRERVLTALDHREPDRVPIDLGGFQTGIHRVAYERLTRHLGLDDDVVILDPVQQLAKPSEDVLERLRVDTRYLTTNPPSSSRGGLALRERGGRLWHDLTDEFGVVWSMPDDHLMYMDISHHPLADASVADLAHYPWPVGNDSARFTGLRERVAEVGQDGHYAVCTGIGGVIYEYCWYMRGLERWYMDMIEDPGFCAALLDRVLAYWTDYYTGYMTEVGDLVDVVMIGDDLAGQCGPLFSPAFYREVVKPRQSALVQHIKSMTSAKLWYHTCGACVDLIPDLLDNGIDILNPVQISAAGMDPVELKRRFGDRLVFWGGGVDSQHVLPKASPEEVRRQARRNIEALMPGGGFIFNNVHNVQADVPPHNVLALFDAAYEYGRYT